MAAAATSKGRVIAGSFVARVLAGKAASPSVCASVGDSGSSSAVAGSRSFYVQASRVRPDSRRAVHASAYDKNLEEQVRPAVVPDHVIGSAVNPDKYWGPHPTTGVFGPAVDAKVAAGTPATGANGGGSVLDQKVWFRPLEDVEKPSVA